MKYQTNKSKQIIEAFQMTKPHLTCIEDWPKWLMNTWDTTRNEGGALFSCASDLRDENYLVIKTMCNGLEIINEDDWIIRTETKHYLKKINNRDFRSTYVPHVKAPDGCFDRDDFMEYFRSDTCSEELSTDDKLEIFLGILPGKSDITKELLDQLLCEYSVETIDITETRPKGTLAERLEEYNKRLVHVQEDLRTMIIKGHVHDEKIKMQLVRARYQLRKLTDVLYFVINTMKD